MTALDTYSSAVRGIAIELDQLLSENDLREAAEKIARSLGIEGIKATTGDEQDKALRFLAQTPSQRAKLIERLEPRVAALLILRARYFGLRAAKILSIAADLQFTPGASYRNAARRAAEVAEQIESYPSLEDILEDEY